MRLLHRGLEGWKIDLVRCPRIDDRVRVVTQELGVVAYVVFDRRADALLLHAGDVADGDVRGEEGIFAEGFEVAASARRTIDVHAGPEHEVDSACPPVAPNPCANAFCELAVPARRQPDATRIRRRRKPG